MADQPLSSATHRRLGEPLPHQQANGPRGHPSPPELSRSDHAIRPEYPVLAPVSRSCPRERGRFPTCYSPVRHFIHPPKRVLIVRLACVKHAASVHPEPGSNSPWKMSQTRKPAIYGANRTWLVRMDPPATGKETGAVWIRVSHRFGLLTGPLDETGYLCGFETNPYWLVTVSGFQGSGAAGRYDTCTFSRCQQLFTAEFRAGAGRHFGGHKKPPPCRSGASA